MGVPADVSLATAGLFMTANPQADTHAQRHQGEGQDAKRDFFNGACSEAASAELLICLNYSALTSIDPQGLY